MTRLSHKDTLETPLRSRTGNRRMKTKAHTNQNTSDRIVMSTTYEESVGINENERTNTNVEPRRYGIPLIQLVKTTKK